MNKQSQINKAITDDLARCQELYSELESLLAGLPEGSLSERNGKCYHTFRKGGKQYQKVINNKSFEQDLKMKQFLKRGLPVLKQRIEACKSFLKKEVYYDPLNILGSMPDVYKGIEDYNLFLDGDIDPEKWAQESYKRNTRNFITEHYTANMVPVRSKAEAMIGTQIEHRNWLYRCEPQMWFGQEIKCPDFAILLPNTRKIVYLEHFGRMDELGYVMDTMNKLILYRQYGLHLGVNFFFTWECQIKPLNIKEIDAVLDEIMALDK